MFVTCLILSQKLRKRNKVTAEFASASKGGQLWFDPRSNVTKYFLKRLYSLAFRLNDALMSVLEVKVTPLHNTC